MSEGSSSDKSSTPSPNLELENDVKKHPLENQWTLWYYGKSHHESETDWKGNLKEVITISTVEDFWALYNNIEKASNLNRGCDYALFKKGIKPMWEDHSNAEGGKWLIQMDKRLRQVVVDKLWLKIMMCLIGESFGTHGQIINGAVVNIRGKQDKISVWLSDSSKSKAVMFIGEQLKRIFDKEENLQSKSSRLVFQLLKDSFTRESYAKTYDYQNYLK